MLDALLFAKTPELLKVLYPDCIWQVAGQEKKLYLTFDDGPIPETTPWILEELKRWNAQATFFCVGKNVVTHPAFLQQIIAEGHTVGNHTFSHQNGWNCANQEYYADVQQGADAIRTGGSLQNVKFFRPPYGKLKPAQYIFLKQHYRIVMWDVLSYDFDQSEKPQAVLQRVLQHTQAGSVVVFHDSLKAKKNMSYALPRALAHFSEQGFKFEALC